MYERMQADMDLDAGTILSAGRSVGEVGIELFQTILRVASGDKHEKRVAEPRRARISAVAARADLVIALLC